MPFPFLSGRQTPGAQFPKCLRQSPQPRRLTAVYASAVALKFEKELWWRCYGFYNRWWLKFTWGRFHKSIKKPDEGSSFALRNLADVVPQRSINCNSAWLSTQKAKWTLFYELRNEKNCNRALWTKSILLEKRIRQQSQLFSPDRFHCFNNSTDTELVKAVNLMNLSLFPGKGASK